MICSRISCENEARWYPVMLFYAPRRVFPHAPPARAVVGVAVCDDHKEIVTLRDLLSDEGWQQILAGFARAGKAQPDRLATRLEFIAIDSAEARDVQRARGH